MRIGIEMMAVQLSDCRERGIHRYASQLVSHLLACDRGNQYVLYYYEGLGRGTMPWSPNLTIRVIRRATSTTHPVLYHLEEITSANPDGLDLLLMTCPFTNVVGYPTPPRPLNDLKLAALVYDLIPAIYQEHYQGLVNGMYRATLDRLRRYDLLLAISEATRKDFARLLRIEPDRIVNIRGASDFPVVERVTSESDDRRDLLPALGIAKPFVFTVGAGLEWRKNYQGALRAFAALPAALRDAHQLVVAGKVREEDAEPMRELAADVGVTSHLVLTGYIPDASLQALYRHCAAFVFPSLYEGFGLPILEAMQCGAPVIAGNNSSQPEVLGDAGLLADARDAGQLAAQLSRVLTDGELADTLRGRGPIQARNFRWEQTAATALAALERTAGSNAKALHAGRPTEKPRLAFFAPLPQATEVADYAACLLAELKNHYAIDLYHHPGYIPYASLAGSEFGCHDYRLFDRRARLLNYRGILYQMSDGPGHRFVYENLLRHPGIVTLHDASVADLHAHYEAAVIVHHCCPSEVVVKVPLGDGASLALKSSLRRLADGPNEAQRGQSPRDHALRKQYWSRVAGFYIDLIEKTAAQRKGPAKHCFFDPPTGLPERELAESVADHT